MADPISIFKPHPSIKFDNVNSSCLCGNITFCLHGPLIYHTLCSCSNCRKATGSLVGCETLIPASTLTILTGNDLLKTYTDNATESGVPMMRQFCSNCGSQLFAITPLAEDMISIFAGSWVKSAEDWKPMREQFHSSNVVGKWLEMPKEYGKRWVRTETNPLSEEVND